MKLPLSVLELLLRIGVGPEPRRVGPLEAPLPTPPPKPRLRKRQKLGAKAKAKDVDPILRAYPKKRRKSNGRKRRARSG